MRWDCVAAALACIVEIASDASQQPRGKKRKKNETSGKRASSAVRRIEIVGTEWRRKRQRNILGRQLIDPAVAAPRDCTISRTHTHTRARERLFDFLFFTKIIGYCCRYVRRGDGVLLHDICRSVSCATLQWSPYVKQFCSLSLLVSWRFFLSSFVVSTAVSFPPYKHQLFAVIIVINLWGGRVWDQLYLLAPLAPSLSSLRTTLSAENYFILCV